MGQADHELYGELRAGLEAARADLDEIGWPIWALVQLEAEPQAMGLERIARELEVPDEPPGWLAGWAQWATRGARALEAQLRRQAPQLRAPRQAAASWLAAWVWRCGVRGARGEGVGHVVMGLGEGQVLSMEYLVESRARRVMWHVVVRRGALEVGQFNTRAALRGWPGLPAHLPGVV